MHLSQIVWLLVLLVGLNCALFLALCAGIKLGHKWGEEGAESWLKLKFRNFVEFRLGQPLMFLNEAYGKGSENGVRVPGILELDFAEPEDADIGLPFKFNFTPSEIQQKPRCC